MRRSAALIPMQEKAGPTVMMHGLGVARKRDDDFEHAHECVFEDDFVAIGRGLHSVVAIGELGFVLSVKIKMTSEQRERTCKKDGENELLEFE